MQIEITLEPLTEYTRYAPLAVLGYWLTKTKFLAPLWEPLNWPIKVYEHSPIAKLEALLAGILSGNRAVCQINTTIHPDPLLAKAWGQEHFPKQSTISDFLNTATETQVAQLQQGFATLLHRHSRTFQHDFSKHWLLIDYDVTGLLIAKSAEGSEKGFFPGHRNRYGRQLVRITAPTYHETLASFFHPGNTHACKTVKGAITELENRLHLSLPERKRIIVHGNGALGTDANINWLLWRG